MWRNTFLSSKEPFFPTVMNIFWPWLGLYAFSGFSNTFDHMSVYTTKAIRLNAFLTIPWKWTSSKVFRPHFLLYLAVSTCDQIDKNTSEYQVKTGLTSGGQHSMLSGASGAEDMTCVSWVDLSSSIQASKVQACFNEEPQRTFWQRGTKLAFVSLFWEASSSCHVHMKLIMRKY